MLASIVDNGGLVTVIASSQNDTVVITSTSNPGFTDISINYDQPDAVFFSQPTSSIDNILVYAGAGNDNVYSSTLLPTEINGQAGDDVLNGGSANDIIRGGSGEDRINGRLGDDVLSGGDDRDLISGASGADRIFGEGGNDVINGHAGDDFISACDGDDVVIGGNGNDLIFGGLGEDNISGNAGEDELYGNEGNDRIDGGTGNDLLAGREGDDSLFGEGGDDFIVGLTGDDFLVGGSGNDFLDGMDGMDSLFGGGGQDFLEGGADTDVDQLNGGAAADTFVTRNNDVLDDVSTGFDTVLDYQTGDDGGNVGNDIQPFSGLLGLFGVGLTGSVSSLEFDIAVAALGAGTDVGFGTTVFNLGLRNIAVQSSGGGIPGVGQTSLLATFPAEFPAAFATDLIPFKTDSSTIHVENNGTFGRGAVNRLILEEGDFGNFVVEQIGTATLAGDLLNSSLDGTQVAFLPSASLPDELVLRSGVEDLVTVGAPAPLVDPVQTPARDSEVGALEMTLRNITTASALSRLTFPDLRPFFIDDDAMDAINDVRVLGESCTLRGGFDCDDYALAAQNFISSSPDFPANAVVQSWGAFFLDNTSPTGRSGHAVNVINFSPAAGGDRVYLAYDAQTDAFVRAATPSAAVRELIFSQRYADPAQNPISNPLAFVTFGLFAEKNGTFFENNPAILQQFRDALIRAGAPPLTRYLSR